MRIKIKGFNHKFLLIITLIIAILFVVWVALGSPNPRVIKENMGDGSHHLYMTEDQMKEWDFKSYKAWKKMRGEEIKDD